jgi:hypothetical protein
MTTEQAANPGGRTLLPYRPCLRLTSKGEER